MSKKRILSVTLKHVSDYDADTSSLGKYSTQAKGAYSIDRRHEQECNLNSDVTASRDMLERVINRIEETRLLDDEDSPEDILKQEAIALCVDEQEKLEECNCDGVGIDSRSFEYFNTSGNYKGCTPEEIKEYTWQDYERAERYGDSWSYMGIMAQASIGVPIHGDSLLTQRIHSGGLWGIETDSEKSYIEEEEKNQLAELRDQLLAFGFSKRAISTAFKNVKRVDE